MLKEVTLPSAWPCSELPVTVIEMVHSKNAFCLNIILENLEGK